MKLNLEKIYIKGTYRYIGKYCKGLYPFELPIAIKSFRNFEKIKDFDIYKYKNYSEKNVLVLFNQKRTIYVYVNPNYTAYRKILSDILGKIEKNFDVDHVLGKNIAKKLNLSYVLLSVIPKTVNRSHGTFEKEFLDKEINNLNLIYANDRIYHKILFRKASSYRVIDFFSNEKEKLKLNILNSKPSYGLTLKQLGIWHSAFGLDILKELKINKNHFKRLL